MPKNDYAAGESIEFAYRCSGPSSTADPVAVVLDELGAIHATLTVGSGIELKHGKTYLVTFTPDEIGTWIVNITDTNGGDASKSFGVATHGMAWVVAELETQTLLLADQTEAIIALAGLTDGGAHIG